MLFLSCVLDQWIYGGFDIAQGKNVKKSAHYTEIDII
jgi:hypothetical protein